MKISPLIEWLRPDHSRRFFGVLRENAFRRNIAIAAEEGLNLLAREVEMERVEDTLVRLSAFITLAG
jgi:hypothetical protein